MRVVYRGDFDGTVCAAMLLELDKCDKLFQAHPQDVQDRKVLVTGQDIICNLPYHPDCHMWFDHRSGKGGGSEAISAFAGTAKLYPSAAHLVWQRFEEELTFLGKYSGLVEDADLFDGGLVTLEHLGNPTGSVLLALLLDPRTGLGHTHNFTISNFQWSTQIPELLTMHSVEAILELPDTAQRVKRYRAAEAEAKEFFTANSHLDGNVIVSDLRGKQIPVGNRFLVYALPGLKEGNISVRITDGKQGVSTSISVGHSIVNRTSSLDVGNLCHSYGGGGHEKAAACQVSPTDADWVFQEILAACKE